MDESEINTMNQSFNILNKRREKLLGTQEIIELKDKVKKIREESINHIDELRELAVRNLQDNGIEVILADDAVEALNSIYNIIGNEKIVAKSKSNTAGEIGLSDFLEYKGVKVVETDLGDRIVQFTPQRRSSHPIGPAAHLKMGEIAEILSDNLGKPIKPEPREILDVVKENVLEELSNCRVGVTGANSLSAKDGSIVLVHNEGNISLVSMLDTHIVILGIDKLVETIEDAVSVVKLETVYATGKTVPAYINVISAPSKTADIEQIHLDNMYGARRVIVILLDNGRSKALKECPECLYCIGCGSCLLYCPVYSVSGYEFGYNKHLGGKGIVLSRYVKDEETCYEAGLYTCTLCGHCTLDCPMEIPINYLIEKLRRESVTSHICNDKHVNIAENIKNNGSPFK